MKNGSKVTGVFRGSHSSIEFCLCRTGGSDRLCLTLIRDTSSRQHESIASGRSAVAKVIGMGSIKETRQVSSSSKRRKLW